MTPEEFRACAWHQAFRLATPEESSRMAGTDAARRSLLVGGFRMRSMADERKPYEAPTLTRLGSVRDLTLSAGASISDGGGLGKTKNPPRS